jgi:small subunit ribosomal protein S5
MRFRATLAIGDKKGRVGMGVAKGADVTSSVNKAFNQAKKKLIKVTIVNETIPHQSLIKYKAAKILLKPAPKGTGIKVGGAVRIVCELAGIANIRGKILGSNNKISNLRAALIALQSFKKSGRTENQSNREQQEKKHCR